jgi:hypothetical protein
MGILIAAGFGFIGYEVYNRVSDPERRAEPSAPPPPPPGGIAETALDLPSGATIDSVVAVGSRVVFSVRLPNAAGDRLYVLDPRNGAVTATVTTAGSKPNDAGPAAPRQ